VSTTPAISCSPVSTTPATNLSPVSTTPAINPCHGFSVIAGVVDNGDKFIAGDNDTGDKFIALTMTPAINLLPVTTTSVIRVCGVSMNMSFHGGLNKPIGGRVRLRRPELLPFWFEVVLAASGASNQGIWGVYGCVFMVVPMTPSAIASDPSSQRYCCLIVSTVFSPLSLTPVNNFSAVSLTPAIKLLNDTGE
jgi:hypothetical protein